MNRTFLLAVVALFALALPLLTFAQADDDAEPVYLRDRGTGIPTSMFGTYIHGGEWLVYPFFEYYYNPDEEYKPAELGYGKDEDYLSEYRANEYLIFLAYGITDRLALETEIAGIAAELNKSGSDPSGMPSEIEESGLGDVQTLATYNWRAESRRGLGTFSYFEVVYPFNKNKPLTGTSDFEFKLGQGIIKGFNWGTMKARGTIEYIKSEGTVEPGEFALEYLKRLNQNWRGVLAVEGFQDEWELITEAQYHLVKDRLFIKFNNAFGLTPKAPNWAPEYGVLIAF